MEGHQGIVLAMTVYGNKLYSASQDCQILVSITACVYDCLGAVIVTVIEVVSIRISPFYNT